MESTIVVATMGNRHKSTTLWMNYYHQYYQFHQWALVPILWLRSLHFHRGFQGCFQNLVGQSHIYLHQHQTRRLHHRYHLHYCQHRLHRYRAIRYYPLGMHHRHRQHRHHLYHLQERHRCRLHQSQLGSPIHQGNQFHTMIHHSQTSCHCHHQSLQPMLGLM